MGYSLYYSQAPPEATDARALTLLCIATYVKGQEFMREAKRLGCRVVLLTLEKRRDADWPREILDDIFYIPKTSRVPTNDPRCLHMARTVKIDRIVALDDSTWSPPPTREHMRIPAWARPPCATFATSCHARTRHQAGILVRLLSCSKLRCPRDFLAESPRRGCSSRARSLPIGIRKLEDEDLWPLLDQLATASYHH